MSASGQFPLITLQPAWDPNNSWVALLLESDVPLDGAALAHVLSGLHLDAVLDSLSCVARVDAATVDPALGAALPAGRVVLRIPADEASDAQRCEMLGALYRAGFGLMADGVPQPGAALCEGVGALAVACPGHAAPTGFGAWLQRLPGPHLALGSSELACPGFCKFHWLAGHLAGQASPAGKGQSGSRALLIKLLSLVTSDADTAALEAVIKRDPGLSYNLLKLVNSVAFAPGSKIANFNQAIAILGRRQLQRWLQLLLYARPQGSDKASPLLPRAALRARLMEDLARHARLTAEQQDHAFMIGMFSLLDVLFEAPLAEIIAPLNLAEPVVQALVAGDGPLGGLLAVVRASEEPAMPALAAALAAVGIASADWAALLVEAACWAVQVGREA